MRFNVVLSSHRIESLHDDHVATVPTFLEQSARSRPVTEWRDYFNDITINSD